MIGSRACGTRSRAEWGLVNGEWGLVPAVAAPTQVGVETRHRVGGTRFRVLTRGLGNRKKCVVIRERSAQE